MPNLSLLFFGCLNIFVSMILWSANIDEVNKSTMCNKGHHWPRNFYGLDKAIDEDCYECAQATISAGADLYGTSDGSSALHNAVGKNRLAIVQLLLKARADINRINSYRCTPLRVAVNTEFLENSRKKNIEIVKLLLENKARLDIRDGELLSPVHSAAAYGHLPALKLFLTKNISVNDPAHSGFTCLSLACLRGKKAIVQYLLSVGAEIDIPLGCDYRTLDEGDTPLRIALIQRECNIAELLIKSGADPYIKNSCGKTAIHAVVKLVTEDQQFKPLLDLIVKKANKQNLELILACAISHKNKAVAITALDSGANINARIEGCCMLEIAAKTNDKEILSLLIEKGATIPDNTANQPWICTISHSSTLLKYFLKLPFFCHFEDYKNIKKSAVTFLCYIERIKRTQNIKIPKPLLLNKIMKPCNLWFSKQEFISLTNSKNPVHKKFLEEPKNIAIINELHGLYHLNEQKVKTVNWEDPLFHALCDGNIDIVDCILTNSNFNINDDCIHSCTALHIACAYGQKAMVAFLITKGACAKAVANLSYNDVYDRDNALHVAIKSGNFDCASLLLDADEELVSEKNGQMRTILHMLFSQPSPFTERHLSIFERVLKKVDISSTDHGGNTALHLAARFDNIKGIETLMHYGAAYRANNRGETPLHTAILYKSYNAIKYFLSKNNDSVNTKDSYGATPLKRAVDQWDETAVMLLISHGADITILDNQHENILHRAISQGNINILKTLLSQPNIENIINIKNNKHQTPLMIAVKTNYLDIVKLLIEHNASIAEADLHGITVLHMAASQYQPTLVLFLLNQKQQKIAVKMALDTVDNKGRSALQLIKNLPDNEGLIDKSLRELEN